MGDTMTDLDLAGLRAEANALIERDRQGVISMRPHEVLALIDRIEAAERERDSVERQLSIRQQDSIARRLAMATIAEVGTETAAGDAADTLAELLIEAEERADRAETRLARVTEWAEFGHADLQDDRREWAYIGEGYRKAQEDVIRAVAAGREQ